MPKKWEIIGGILRHRIDTDIYEIPVAAEIFSAVFGTEKVKREWAKEIARDLPELRFSKISSQIHMHFWFECGRVNYELAVRRQGVNISIIPAADFPDHYVYNNKWFYISNMTQDVRECLNRWTTHGSSIISIGQYISLLKELQTKHI